jgi:hypothetical protein
MKINCLLFLILILSTQAKAQKNISKDPYIPVLADTLYWWEVEVPEFNPYQVVEYHTELKQLFNDTIYHFIGGRWLCEDTTLRKVYHMSAEPGIGYRLIWYDFSLKEGDSARMWIDYIMMEKWLYVDSIRFTETFAGPRKAWYLHFDYDQYDSEHPIWVEGIGSLAGFFKNCKMPRLDWWEWGILNCWYADDVLIYESSLAQQYGCDLSLIDVKDIHPENGVSVYPVPTSGQVTVNIEKTYRQMMTVELIDLYGKIVQITRSDESTFQVPTSDLLPGIYILSISDQRSIVYRNKIIINR